MQRCHAVDAIIHCEVPETWLPPADASTGSDLRLGALQSHGSTSAGGLERSELGLEVSLDCDESLSLSFFWLSRLSREVRIWTGNCGSETVAAGANFRTAMFAGANRVALNWFSFSRAGNSSMVCNDEDLCGSWHSPGPGETR